MEISRQNIIVSWFAWQFFEVPRLLFQIWGNYLSFTEKYFSVILLAKTLFAPWRRYNWAYPRAFDIYQFSLTLTSNLFSRFLGAMLRIVLIAAGILAWIAVACIGLVGILLWIAFPLVIAGGFYLLATI